MCSQMLFTLLTVVSASLAPHSLVEQKVGTTKDYTQEIADLEENIASADNQNAVASTSAAQQLNDKFGALTELKNKVASNNELSQQESTTVSDTISTTTQESQQAFNAAQNMLKTQQNNAVQQRELKEEVAREATAGQAMLKGAEEMGIMVDQAEFQGSFNDVVNKAAQKDRYVGAALEKAKMKFAAKTSALESKEALFIKTSKTMSDDSRAMASKATTDLKNTKSLLKFADKDLTKQITKTHKAINKLPKDEKVINTKEIDKYIASEEKGLDKDIKRVLKNSEKAFKKGTKYADKAYKVVAKTADKAGSDVMKEVNKAIKNDKKYSERTQYDAKNLGDDLRDLSKKAKAQSKEVDVDAAKFTQDARTALRESLSKLKTLKYDLGKEADTRVPATQADVDAMAAEIDSTVGRSATKLAGDLSESTDQLDAAVQDATMSTGTEEATMESTVNQDKTAANGLASATASTDAEIMAAATAAEKVELAAKSKEASAEFDIKLKLSELNQALKVDEMNYQVKSNGAIEKLGNLVKAAIPKVEQPVWAQLQNTLRKLTDMLDQGKLKQVEQLGGIQQQLNAVQDIMARHGSQSETTAVEVPKLQSDATTGMNRLNASLVTLEGDRARARKAVEQEAALGVSSTSNEVSDQLEGMRRDTRDHIGERTRMLFDQLSTLTRMVKNIEGDNSANAQEVTESQNYIRDKQASLATELKQAQDKQAASIVQVSSQIKEISGPKITELAKVGGRATAAARAFISQSMDATKSRTSAELGAEGQKLDASLSSTAASATETVKKEGDRLRQTFAASADVLTKGVEEQKARGQDLKFAAAKAQTNAKAVLSDLERQAASATSEADRMAEDTKKRMEYIEKDSENLATVVEGGTQGALKTAEHGISAARSKVETKVSGGMSALSLHEQENQKANLAALDFANDRVLEQAKIVNEADSAAQQTMQGVESNFQKTEQEMAEDLDEQGKSEQNNEEQTHEDLNAFSKAFGSTEARNAAVLTTMEEDAGDIQSERDEAADEITNAVTSEVKMIQTEQTASFTGVDGSLHSAQQNQKQSQEDLAAEEKILWQKATDLDQSRMQFENSSAFALNQFKGLVSEEKNSLNNNVDYLDKYERYSHQRELGMIQAAVDLLKQETMGSDKVFNEIEMQEETFANEVSKLMGGSEFQTLKKIMDVDMYVQKATQEDESAVEYLNRHEETSLPWMKKVLESLDDVHATMSANEAENRAEDANIEQKGAARTAGAIGNLEDMVKNGGNDMPLGDLEKMGSESVNMLSGEAREADARDTAKLNSLQSASGAQGDAASSQVAYEKGRFQSAQTAVGGTGRQVAQMNNDVQGLLDYNAKMVQAEKKRLEKRASDVSQKMFFGSLAQTGESVETTHAQRLEMLLQKNTELTEQNKALDAEHSTLGKKIEKVADLEHQLRVA